MITQCVLHAPRWSKVPRLYCYQLTAELTNELPGWLPTDQSGYGRVMSRYLLQQLQSPYLANSGLNMYKSLYSWSTSLTVSYRPLLRSLRSSWFKHQIHVSPNLARRRECVMKFWSQLFLLLTLGGRSLAEDLH